VEAQSTELEPIIQQIAEAMLATTETVELLSKQVDTLTQQVQQQGYQIFALSDAVQTLAENHDSAIERLDRLTDTLQQLVTAIANTDKSEP
jgi:ABC-type transporter Mla subunit MlaD